MLKKSRFLKLAVTMITAVLLIAAFSVIASARNVILYDILPKYDIKFKFVSNSTDTRDHVEAGFYNDELAHNLLYAYTRSYYPGNEPSAFMLKDNISIDTSKYNEVFLEYETYIREGNDSDVTANNIRIYLSYDNGATYTTNSVGVTVTKNEGDVYHHTKNTGTGVIYTVKTADLKSFCGSQTITNVKIVPCVDTSKAKGAFRLLSLRIHGSDSSPELYFPTFPNLVKVTNEPVTENNGKYGYTIYKTDFTFNDGWITNTVAHGLFSGKLDGEPKNYMGFVLGVNRIYESTYTYKYSTDANYTVDKRENKPLKVITPNIKFDTVDYDAITGEMHFWINPKSDPMPNFKIYYSDDNGFTWSARTVTAKISETDSKFSTSNGASYKVYKATFNVKSLTSMSRTPGKPITNIMICPFPDIKNGNAEFFRLLDFKITAESSTKTDAPVLYTYDIDYDSKAINQLIKEAIASGKKEATIPAINPRTGTNEYIITDEIVLSSNFTLYLEDCTLRRSVYNYNNIITNKDAYLLGLSIEDEIENIHVIGIGDACLMAGIDNGHNKFSRSGRSGNLNTTYTNNLLFFRNVNNFSVQNIECKEPTFWCMNFVMCRNGLIDNIRFQCTNKIINQDGIDLRVGNNNFVISNIYGTTGDDTIALTALGGSSEKNQLVKGKDLNIHDVVIKNVYSRVIGSCFNIRLLCHDGSKIYNVDIDNVIDIAGQYSNGQSRATVVLGHSDYFTKECMGVGDIDKVTISNVSSWSTKGAIWVYHQNVHDEHFTYNNVVSTRANVPVIHREWREYK